jgi:hypothetical protein
MFKHYFKSKFVKSKGRLYCLDVKTRRVTVRMNPQKQKWTNSLYSYEVMLELISRGSMIETKYE